MSSRGNLCRRVETEEAGQGLGRTLLDQEMAAVQRLSGDVVRPGTPDREGVVPGREGSTPAPQDLRGTGDRAARAAVLVVQPAVTGRAGAIVLADGLDDCRVLDTAAVVSDGLGCKAPDHAAELGVEEEELRVLPDDPLGHRVWQGERRPRAENKR